MRIKGMHSKSTKASGRRADEKGQTSKKGQARSTRDTSTKALPPKQIFYDEKWVATRLGMSVKTLQKRRYSGEGGPTFVTIGSSVRYRIQDIRKFERSLKRYKSTSE